MKSIDECTPDSPYELYDSPYALFRGDKIYYEYDDVVRFVFKAFFSALKLAATHLATPIVTDECLENSQDSPMIILRRIEHTANQYLKETMHHEYASEALSYHLAALLVQTNEMRDATERCGGDIEKLQIDKIMDSSGFRDCIVDALRYYLYLFENDFLPCSSEELKLIRPTTTHYTIDYSPFVTTLCGIVVYTYFDIFKIYPLYHPLHDEVKDALCACLFPLFAELHYECEDLDCLLELLKNSRHSNKYKMELTCRYPQIAKEVVNYLEELYNEALRGNSEEDDKFVTDNDTESQLQSYLKELQEERDKAKDLQTRLDDAKKSIESLVGCLFKEKNVSDVIDRFANNSQSLQDKYKNHYLMTVVQEGKSDKLSSLLEKLEKFRVDDYHQNVEIDEYVFDFSKWQKSQIYNVLKEIRPCLGITRNSLGEYLLAHTNLGKTKRSLGTILNQL